MKTILFINGSPRKNFNTATLVKEAQKGAEEAGAKTELIHLGTMNFKGCISCFACKRKGALHNPLCTYKDDLTPLLEKILHSDGVVIGTPIYYSYPSSMVRALLERMMFAAHTYVKDEGNIQAKSNPDGVTLTAEEEACIEEVYTKRKLDRIIPVGLIYTMNCPEGMAKEFNYPLILSPDKMYLEHIFGHCEVLYSYDTYQFKDYSKYDMDLFDEKEKRKTRETQFPVDKQNAFALGKQLAEFQ